jgi:hypothetical protein
MNINSRVDYPRQISYYSKKRGFNNMKDYSTLNPTSELVDMGTSSPNFIVTSLIGSAKPGTATGKTLKKRIADKGVSGNNVLSTSKSHLS